MNTRYSQGRNTVIQPTFFSYIGQNKMKITIEISVEDLELLRDMRNCVPEPTTIEDTLVNSLLENILQNSEVGE